MEGFTCQLVENVKLSNCQLLSIHQHIYNSYREAWVGFEVSFHGGRLEVQSRSKVCSSTVQQYLIGVVVIIVGSEVLPQTFSYCFSTTQSIKSYLNSYSIPL